MNNCDFTDLAVPGVRTLQPYQPGKPESELRREYGLKRIIKLASNENPLGPSPAAIAAIQAALSELARYPDGNGFQLKKTLAEHHRVPPESITLGNGSNDVLELVARAFLGPGREAVFSQYAFAVYPIATQAAGATARIAAAYPAHHAMAYGHDLEAMEAAIDDQTRVVFIANPNNPTGTWNSRQSLEDFLDRIPPQILVVIDEAYAEYVEAADYSTAIPWLERFPNLILTRTFSKIYGLAGLRVGYAVSHPQISELLNRVRQPFNVNSLALTAAVAALQDTDHLRQSREVNRAGLRQLRTALGDLGLNYLPSAGNFICVEMDHPGREWFATLLTHGIIVRPLDNYGMPDFLRISVGTESENQALIDTLHTILKG